MISSVCSLLTRSWAILSVQAALRQTWAMPKDAADVKRFVGMVNFVG